MERKRDFDYKKTIFLTVLLFIPLLNFLVFYVGVNINSILLSVKQYDVSTDAYTFIGLDNFAKFLNDAFNDKVMLTRIKNSAIQYSITLFIAMPIGVLVSYSVWKKIPMAGFFKVILFLPSMISSAVFVIIAKYFIEYFIPAIFNPNMQSLINTRDTAFQTMMVYSLWIGFAGNLVLYLGAMSRISDSVIESAMLEGANSFQEFWYIVLPSIYSTMTTFIVVGIAGFFSNYGHFYTFYGIYADDSIQTLGYYFFVSVVNKASYAEYPYASAAGIIFTLVAAPITLIVKTLLEKFGPSED